jgi:hypothetical protein
MSNALSEEKKQQVIALGKLGWSLRKIERETGVRRETAGAYLIPRTRGKADAQSGKRFPLCSYRRNSEYFGKRRAGWGALGSARER